MGSVLHYVHFALAALRPLLAAVDTSERCNPELILYFEGQLQLHLPLLLGPDDNLITGLSDPFTLIISQCCLCTSWILYAILQYAKCSGY